MIILLSKPNCTQCNSLKMLLKFAFNDQYKDSIQIVDQEENPEMFKEYQEKFQVLALPVLIKDEHILRQCDPSKTKAFLEEHKA